MARFSGTLRISTIALPYDLPRGLRGRRLRPLDAPQPPCQTEPRSATLRAGRNDCTEGQATSFSDLWQGLAHQRHCQSLDPYTLLSAVGDGYASADDPIAATDALCAENRIVMPRFGDQEFNGSLWDAGDAENRTWQWALHSWFPFDNLIKAHALTGRERYLALIERLCAEWEERFFARAPQESEFPWHDHATAYRLERICKLRLLLLTRGDRAPRLDVSLAHLAGRHMEILEDEDFYSRHTNHGYDQSVALLLGAHVFPEHAASSRWAGLATERIRDEVGFAFTSEGIHVENSPGYHAGMIDNLARTEKILRAARCEEIVSLQPIIDGAVEFMAFMLRPDRFLPCIGDTVQRRPNPRAPSLAGAKTLPALLFAVTGGAEGTAPAETTRLYAEAGYAAYRSSWKSWGTQTHLIVKCGIRSAYHRHDDDLNVLLHAHGEDWLIDSGMYNHQQKDPVRIYMRSAAAHNVPFVQGARAARKPGADEPDWGLRPIPEPGSATVFAVRATSMMYTGLTLQRDVRVEESGMIGITDTVAGRDIPPVYSLWHVPADRTVHLSENAAVVSGRRKQMTIRLADGAEKVKIAQFTGRTSDRFWSLRSDRFNRCEDSTVIVFGPLPEVPLRYEISFGNRSAPRETEA